MNFETLCFVFFVVELVLQIYMSSSKRIKKYWSVYVGIVIAAYFFPFCLPPGESGIRGFFADLTAAMWLSLPLLFSVGIFIIANINRKEQKVQTDWKTVVISLAFFLAPFVGLAYIVR